MIIMRIQGGFGNQLFQAAMANAFRKSDRELVIYDLYHLDSAATKRTYRLGTVGLSAPHFRDPMILNLLLLLSRLVRGKRMRFLEESAFGFDPKMMRGPEADLYLHGYFQSWRYVQPQLEWLRRAVSDRRVSRRMDPELCRQIAAQDSVSIHVRRGDYLSKSENTKLHGTCPPEYYQTAYNQLSSLREIRRVFVFTDDTGYAETVATWFQVPCRTVSVDGVDGDLVEFFLLTQSQNIIIANSTFSYWAALLSRANSPVVFAPRRWFAGRDIDTESFFPPQWVII